MTRGPAARPRARVCVRRSSSGARRPIGRNVRNSRAVLPVGLALTGVSIAVAFAATDGDDWNLPLAAVLLAFAVFTERFRFAHGTKTEVVGSLPAFVLAAVLIGPAPAVVIALIATLLTKHSDRTTLAADLATYSIFPLGTALFAEG